MKFSIKKFFTDNKFKKLTIMSYIYSAIFRFQIKFIKPKKLKKHWGKEGVESDTEESREHYLFAAHVSQTVNRICNKTSWESKCLVRALTAQRMLVKQGIPSTMYLGVREDNGKMLAHAWLRVGKMIVTGGEVCDGFTVVDKFCK